MEVEYDPHKNARNIAKHGISLALAESFEWETAQIEEDARFDYPEQRFEATGYIGQRLHVMIYCLVDGDDNVTRIISLRRAEPKEYRRYAET